MKDLRKLEQKNNMDKNSISVIIPTHNSETTIKACLDSLILQSIPREQFEIIVVDDGSTDNTVNLAKTYSVDNILYIEPCSVGKARNLGVKSSRGTIIAFLDSDCKANEGWLKAISENISSKNAITGPILNGNPQSLVAWAEYFLEFGGYYEHNKIFPVRFIPGCNQAYSKEVFLKTAGFSDKWLSEDVLFGEELKKLGLKAFFYPHVQIFHLCRTDLQKVLSNMRTLGKYSVRTRKMASVKYGRLFLRKFFVPVIFLGKIVKSMNYAFKARKLSKFILSLPYVILASAAFCKGVWIEIGND